LMGGRNAEKEKYARNEARTSTNMSRRAVFFCTLLMLRRNI